MFKDDGNVLHFASPRGEFADRPEVWRFPFQSANRPRPGGFFPFSSSVQQSGGYEQGRGDGNGHGEECLDVWMNEWMDGDCEREDGTLVSDTIHCPLPTCHITSCCRPFRHLTPHTFHLPYPVSTSISSLHATVADSLRSCCSLLPLSSLHVRTLTQTSLRSIFARRVR